MTQTAQPRTDLAIIAVDERGMRFSDGAQIEAFCQRYANSPLAPKTIRGNVDACVSIVQLGFELGLTPSQALQGIVWIENRDGSGKPSIDGQLYLALIRSQPDLEELEHGFRGKPYEDDFCAWITTKRRGFKPETVEFSVADAKQAKLWGQKKNRDGQFYDTVWSMYPKDQLFWKCVARAGRRSWSDRMKGLGMSQDLAEIGPDHARDVTPRPRVKQLDPVRPAPPPVGPDPLLAAVLAQAPREAGESKVVDAEVVDANTADMAGPTAEEQLDAEREQFAPPITEKEAEDIVDQHREKLGQLSRALDQRAAALAKERKKPEKGIRDALRTQLMRYSGAEGVPFTIVEIDKMIAAVPFATPEGVPADD